MKGKRGVEQIVSVALLILVTIVIAAIAGYYAVNIAQKPDSSCLEALNGISFDDIGFNCKLPDSPDALSGFSVRVSNPDILGFQVGFSDEASADSYQVLEGKSHGLICSLGKHFGDPLEVPASGEVRTYVAKGNFDKMFIAPILRNGETCYSEARREVPLNVRCADNKVITRFRECNSVGGCGDGIVQASEQCDPPGSTQSCVINNIGGTQTCSSACQWGSCERCTLTSASWSETEAYEGTVVTMTVRGTAQCNGENIRLDIWEDDAWPLPDDPIASNLQATFNGDSATFDWETVWTPDVINPPEHYFEATLTSGPNSGNFITSSTELEDELKVYKCGDGIINPNYGEECDGQEGCDAQCRAETGWTCNVNTNPICQQNTYNVCSNGICESRTGTGTSTCTSNLQCQATTHLECLSQTCTVVSGPGEDQCVNVNEPCGTTAVCGNYICEAGEPGVCCGDCLLNPVGICSQTGICGNGRVEFPETCDDGRIPPVSGDGCDANCQIESGWHCTRPGSGPTTSLCCNTAPGVCGENENPLCPNCIGSTGGTINPWDGTNPHPTCDTIGSSSCSYVFGELFGWAIDFSPICPDNLGSGQNPIRRCGAWRESCESPPACCYDPVNFPEGCSWQVMSVCCYEQGLIQPSFADCECRPG